MDLGRAWVTGDEHDDILCERMRCEIKIQNASDFPEKLVGTKHLKLSFSIWLMSLDPAGRAHDACLLSSPLSQQLTRLGMMS